MSNKGVLEFDFSDFDKYFDMLDEMAKGQFKKAIAEWFESCGIDFLEVVRNEIIRRDVTDTRLLLHSFEIGDKHNVWVTKDSGLTLIVGTNVEYAEYVNDGHWTCRRGQKSRWIPGVWNGTKFKYAKNAKTGMVLKQKYIPGRNYWEAAIRIFERMFKVSINKSMKKWRDTYWKNGRK